MNESNYDFHITVSTTPQSDGEISLENEFRLLKTALMYADKVRFCSPVAFMLLQMQHEANEYTPLEIIRMAVDLDPRAKRAVETIDELEKRNGEPKKNSLH